MSGFIEAQETLKNYLIELTSVYSKLIKILKLEYSDIEESDEVALSEHTRLEAQAAGSIISLTKSVYSYLDKIKPDDESVRLLSEAASLRKEASALSKANINLLSGELLRLKSRLSANKLPKSARRVYYSGETPTIMDIKI